MENTQIKPSHADFLYQPETNNNTNKVLIILPDIFGLNEINKEMINEFAKRTGFRTFGLDYFYHITGETTNLSLNEGEKAFGLMNRKTGEDFFEVFNKALELILTQYPQTTEITVCGFCFGGRLATLSTIHPKINKVISFYGAGINKENFYQWKSVLENILAHSGEFEEKDCLFLFGQTDPSLPSEVQESLDQALANQAKSYYRVVYPNAGHAFFNQGRPSFVVEIYEEVWERVLLFLGQ